MTRELISKRTRDKFREFLVGWTLREIEIEFKGADVERDRDYNPDVSGQRRALVEQHYRTLDFTNPGDVRRLLAAYQSILERAKHKAPDPYSQQGSQPTIAELETCLAKEGFLYSAGTIVASTPENRLILEGTRTISEITRRAIFDDLGQIRWSGRFEHPEFLQRICDPQSPEHERAISGAWQHTVRNWDWENDWVFQSADLNLVECSDSFLLRFLCEVVHPAVRPDSDEARRIAAFLNQRLNVDGWQLVEGPAISGKPTFRPHRRATGAVTLPDPVHAKDVLSDEYVRELAEKCDTRLASGDLEGAITVGRTFLEAILSELEVRLTGVRGDHKGDLPKQFKQVTKLLRMDEQRADLDDRFKDVIRGLVMIANGLSPVRNKMSDGHARERKPAPHHARVVVNAAKTVSGFLVQSYSYQVEKGLIRDVARGGKDASA